MEENKVYTEKDLSNQLALGVVIGALVASGSYILGKAGATWYCNRKAKKARESFEIVSNEK